MPSKYAAIVVDRIAKVYSIRTTVSAASAGNELRQSAARSRIIRRDFWALKDVSLSVAKGEVVGIVGSNGAGKSTLLKILSRITEPSAGRIAIYGKLASLLEVGTGFHQELTGRENIYLNGAILGMRRGHINKVFDDIIEFAGVEEFLDTPVKRYSSGMYVRLAFAVAAHLTTDIMIVDEVLAVGDYAFQKKCLGKMRDVAAQDGRTVLFVSHNMAAVRGLCSSAVWLSHGQVAMIGETSSIVDAYLRSASEEGGSTLDLTECARPSFPSGMARLRSICFNNGEPICHGDPFTAAIVFDVLAESDGIAVGFGLSSPEGTRILSVESDLNTPRMHLQPGKGVIATFSIDELHLQPGRYLLDVGIRSGEMHALDFVGSCYQVEVLPGPRTPSVIIRETGGVRYPGCWRWDAFTGAATADR